MNQSHSWQSQQPTSTSPRFDTASPLERLSPPQVMREVQTNLLASRDRRDGGIDELHHQIPSHISHPGIIFYTTDIPVSGSQVPEGVRELHRILFARIPSTDSNNFIRGMVDAFYREKSPQFANTFIEVFNGEVMLDQIDKIESAKGDG